MGGWRGPPGLVTASALARLLVGAPPRLRGVAVPVAAFEAAIAGEAARPHRAHPPPTSNRRCRRRRRRTSRLITDGYLRLVPGEASVPGGVQRSRGRSFYLEPQAPPEPARCTPAASRHARADLRPELSGALRPTLIEAARRAGEEAAVSAYADTGGDRDQAGA